jgi:hypothetical protein
MAHLERETELIQQYYQTDNQIFLSHDLGRGPSRSILRPSNRYASNFHAVQEAIGKEMEQRQIRAFHYSRLTDDEVTLLERDGIHLSTPATLKHRLDNIVSAGGLTRDVADQLYAQSPFHSDQLEARRGKFWMASHPIAVDDGGVEPLMKHWGGEVASMWIRREVLAAPLASLGKPRIIEVAVPMTATKHCHFAGPAVVATFARSRGSITPKQSFDLYAIEPLTPDAVLAVHTEGDASYVEMGRTYPDGFIDVGPGYWKELTGEED